MIIVAKGRNAKVEIVRDGGKSDWVDQNLVRDQMPHRCQVASNGG